MTTTFATAAETPLLQEHGVVPCAVTTPFLKAVLKSANADDDVLRLAYPELRRLASYFLLRERQGHTLQPTALVHEAYLRMFEQESGAKDVAHFVALAARMMRRVLINHALTRNTEKRGGGQTNLPLDEALAVAADSQTIDVLALDEALVELEALDPRQAKLVELRYFGGLSIEDTAAAMSISTATVKREWVTARLWLRRRLNT